MIYWHNLNQDFLDEIISKRPPKLVSWILSSFRKWLPRESGASNHEFHPGKPVRKISGDFLGHYPFAKRLGESLASWDGHASSIVIALYGHWGSGKSSIKNLMLISLQETEPADWINHIGHVLLRNRGLSKYRIVELNSWEWSKQNKLAEAFFETALVALKKRADTKRMSRAAKQLEYYAARLKIFSLPKSDWWKEAKNYLLWVVSFGVGYKFNNITELVNRMTSWPSHGRSHNMAMTMAIAATFGALVGISSLASTALSALAKSRELRAGMLSQTVEEIKEDLARELRRAKSPVIYIVDDIDRLTKDEIRTLFRLVKANADLPNFIFLLLFDRDIVEKCLTDDGAGDGKQFLEKIVQVGLDIPAIRKEDVRNYFTSECLSLGISPTFTQNLRSELVHLYDSDLTGYLRDIRDVNLLVSSLRFQRKIFLKNNVLEVNLFDLIRLETLRVFEPTVYRQVKASKELLVRVPFHHFTRLPEEEKQSFRQRYNALFEKASSKNDAEELLGRLFPLIKAYQNQNQASLNIDDGRWFVERRVASYNLFDLYFVHTMTESSITAHHIQDLVKSSDQGPNGITLTLRAISREADLAKESIWLHSLNFHFAKNPLALVEGVTEFADSLDFREESQYKISQALAAWLFGFIEQVGNKNNIRQILARLRNMRNAEFAAYLSHPLSHYYSSFVGGRLRVPRLQEALLRHLAATRSREVATAFEIKKHGCWYSLRRWAEIEGDDGPRRHLQERLSSLDAVLEFLAWSRSMNMNGIEIISIENFPKFMPWPVIVSVLQGTTERTLTPDEMELVHIFNASYERASAGMSNLFAEQT